MIGILKATRKLTDAELRREYDLRNSIKAGMPFREFEKYWRGIESKRFQIFFKRKFSKLIRLFK